MTLNYLAGNLILHSSQSLAWYNITAQQKLFISIFCVENNSLITSAGICVLRKIRSPKFRSLKCCISNLWRLITVAIPWIDSKFPDNKDRRRSEKIVADFHPSLLDIGLLWHTVSNNLNPPYFLWFCDHNSVVHQARGLWLVFRRYSVLSIVAVDGLPLRVLSLMLVSSSCNFFIHLFTSPLSILSSP